MVASHLCDLCHMVERMRTHAGFTRVCAYARNSRSVRSAEASVS